MPRKDQVGRYKVLLETARCFGRAMDLRTLIDEILNRAQEVMKAEACSILLPDPKTAELIIHTTLARVASLGKVLRVPAGQGIAGAVFNSKQSVNLKDVRSDPRHYKSISEEAGFDTRAMITIPLLNGAECLGVMQALNPREGEFFDAEDEEIFEGFGGLIVNALLRLSAQQQELEAAQARQELLLAKEIQESFLPLGSQQFPFCSLRLTYLPARVVGGDFFFVHLIDSTRLLLGLGDVSGKGIPAALTMARVTAMIKTKASEIENDLGKWVTTLNAQLAEDLKAGRFVCFTFLFADAVSSSLQICSAGQFPPLLFNGQRWQPHPISNQLPLGISPRIQYHAEVAGLSPGDCWLLFSDGIPEGRNSTGKEFTLDRFLGSLPVDRSPATIMETGVRAWRVFVENAPQHDDASVLLLAWHGLPPASEFNISCCPEKLALGREFIEKWAVHAGYDDVTVGKIVMACDEAAANVFSYGYEKKSGPLKYQAGIEHGHLTIRMIDQAKPVDASTIKCRPLSDLRPGGLGTFIMGQVFDEVRYEPQDVGTILTLRKALP